MDADVHYPPLTSRRRESQGAIKRVSSKTELAIAFTIRKRVFVIEQGVSEEIEMDGDDKRAVHFLAFAGEKRWARRDL